MQRHLQLLTPLTFAAVCACGPPLAFDIIDPTPLAQSALLLYSEIAAVVGAVAGFVLVRLLSGTRRIEAAMRRRLAAGLRDSLMTLSCSDPVLRTRPALYEAAVETPWLALDYVARRPLSRADVGMLRDMLEEHRRALAVAPGHAELDPIYARLHDTVDLLLDRRALPAYEIGQAITAVRTASLPWRDQLLAQAA